MFDFYPGLPHIQFDVLKYRPHKLKSPSSVYMQGGRRFNTLPTIDNIIAKKEVNSILRREWRERIKNCLYDEVTKTQFDAQNLDPIIDTTNLH